MNEIINEYQVADRSIYNLPFDIHIITIQNYTIIILKFDSILIPCDTIFALVYMK